LTSVQNWGFLVFLLLFVFWPVITFALIGDWCWQSEIIILPLQAKLFWMLDAAWSTFVVIFSVHPCTSWRMFQFFLLLLLFLHESIFFFSKKSYFHSSSSTKRKFYRTRTKPFGLKVSSPSWLFFFFFLFESHFQICFYFFFMKALIFLSFFVFKMVSLSIFFFFTKVWIFFIMFFFFFMHPSSLCIILLLRERFYFKWTLFLFRLCRSPSSKGIFLLFIRWYISVVLRTKKSTFFWVSGGLLGIFFLMLLSG